MRNPSWRRCAGRAGWTARLLARALGDVPRHQILVRAALSGASFISPQQLRLAIDDFIAGYNEDAVPFHWTKATVRQVQPKHS